MLVNWLLSRLCIREKNEIQIQFLYETFCFEIVEAGGLKPTFGFNIFVDHLKHFFPNIKKLRKPVENSWRTLYRGIALQHLHPIAYLTSNNIQNMKLITTHIPSMFSMKKDSEIEVICEAESGYTSNGNNLIKVVTFTKEGKWSLGIAGKNVDIESINVASTYSLNRISIINTCMIVDKMKLCNGVVVSKSVIVSRYHTLETWQCKSSGGSVRSIRSLSCLRVIPFGRKRFNCKICQHMTFAYCDSNKENRDRSAMAKDENVDKQMKLCKEKDGKVKKSQKPSVSEQEQEEEAQTPSTSEAVAGTSDTVLCKECNRDHDNDEWILCDTCNSWFHRICAGLEHHERWKQFSKENVVWECNYCTDSSQGPKKRKVSNQ